MMLSLLFFYLGTVSCLQTTIRNNIKGLTYLTPDGPNVTLLNFDQGWIKPDGGYKRINLNDSLAENRTGNNFTYGVHVSIGSDIDFYEYSNESPELVVFFYGSLTTPLINISNQGFSVYPKGYSTVDIVAERCSSPEILGTSDPPVLDLGASGFKSLNLLSLTWEWPTLFSRTLPIIQVFQKTGYNNPNCTVPTLIRTSNDDCTETHTLIFDWPSAISENCFYQSDTVGTGDSEQLQYSGTICLFSNETISNPPSPGEQSTFLRNLEYYLNVNFLFSEYSYVTTTITLDAPIEVDVALVGQVHKNTVNPPTTFVYLVTQIGYPFKLRLLFVDAWDIIPEGENNNLTTCVLEEADLTQMGYADSLADLSGSYSLQGWQLVVIPGKGACQVDGIYNGTYVLQITCVDPSSTDCDPPISTGVSMLVTLASENFCGEVVANIGASLVLVPTDQDGLSTVTSLLIGPESRAYFKLSLASIPLDITVTSLVLDRVLVSTPNMPSKPLAVLLENETALNFVILDDTDALDTYFAFDTNDNTLFMVNEASPETMSVTARARISYLGTSKKRDVQVISSILDDNTATIITIDVSVKAVSPGTLVHMSAWVLVIFLMYL